MTLQLVTDQHPQPAGAHLTDPASGLTCRFDGYADGVLLFEVRSCCRYTEDDFLGAAMLQLAVAGTTPITWRVPHRACANRIADTLAGFDQIHIAAPQRPLAA